MSRSLLALCLLALTLCAACQDETQPMEPPGPVTLAQIQPEQDGPYTASFQLRTLTLGERPVPVAIWGPSEATPADLSLDKLIDPAHSQEMASLLAEAPQGCVTDGLSVALDAPLVAGQFPLVLYSHCHECLGVSGATLARRLATWGHVVLMPDHVGNTLWDARAGEGLPLNTDTLALRTGDLTALLDMAQDPDGALADLAEHMDLERVGVAGHSFGAVTVGWMAEFDERVDAALVLAAPVENILLPGVTAANITDPAVLLVAVEDNSILEFGNNILRDNYEEMGGPALKTEVADAGHWSVSDLCGLVEAFDAGCGDGTRQTNGEAFTYMDPAQGRHIAASWAVGLFGATLHGDADAMTWLQTDPGGQQQQIQRQNWP